MKLIHWLLNRKKYKNPKKINIHSAKNYMVAQFRQWQSTMNFLKCPEHIEEQSIWRLNQIMFQSPECFIKGKCVDCGCDIVEKSFEDDACKKCYPELMDKEQWKNYKKQNNIEP